MDLGCVREPNASHDCTAKSSVKEAWDSCIDFEGGIDTSVQYSDHKRCVSHILEHSEVLQELMKNLHKSQNKIHTVLEVDMVHFSVFVLHVYNYHTSIVYVF